MATSRPPPKAMPWIAMITGLAQSSIRVSSGCRSGPPEAGFRAASSSSLISAPEMNVRPAADHHNGANRSVALGCFQSRQNAFGHARAERVHGRIVDGDHGYAVARGES